MMLFHENLSNKMMPCKSVSHLCERLQKMKKEFEKVQNVKMGFSNRASGNVYGNLKHRKADFQ